VPRVTALRQDRGRTHILVELDGAPWRRIPVEIAVRTGLAVEAELGRPELRRLRRELRRAEALDVAVRALRHRDRSRATLRERLARAGVGRAACEDALETLTRSGIVDDERFARARASSLAARGSGDALISADLLAAGVAEETAAAAIGELEPERDRAAGVVAVRGETMSTARWLARRGFNEDAIEAALPRVVADDA
jgi:SOS response regulatory protein OraA/RecX